jgi:hypothetical protein
MNLRFINLLFYLAICSASFSGVAGETKSFAAKQAHFEKLAPILDENILDAFSSYLFCRPFDPGSAAPLDNFPATMIVRKKTVDVLPPELMNLTGFHFKQESSGLRERKAIPGSDTKSETFELRIDWKNRMVVISSTVQTPEGSAPGVLDECVEVSMD